MRRPASARSTIGLIISSVFLLAVLILAVTAMSEPQAKPSAPSAAAPERLQKATFGGGCFWCTEAVFKRLKGVESVASGYSGGTVKNPTYKQVCTGTTGHAEAVQIVYDPAQISYPELLEVFWQTHDPTTLNRQGPDAGTQYRSAVFYHNEEQRSLAEQYKRQLDASGTFGAPLVTEIVPFKEFFPAEDYHQDYFELNGSQPYCALVIRPKVEKFQKAFHDKLKARGSRLPSTDKQPR